MASGLVRTAERKVEKRRRRRKRGKKEKEEKAASKGKREGKKRKERVGQREHEWKILFPLKPLPHEDLQGDPTR